VLEPTLPVFCLAANGGFLAFIKNELGCVLWMRQRDIRTRGKLKAWPGFMFASRKEVKI
jgi:hypothetical protein